MATYLGWAYRARRAHAVTGRQGHIPGIDWAAALCGATVLVRSRTPLETDAAVPEDARCAACALAIQPAAPTPKVAGGAV